MISFNLRRLSIELLFQISVFQKCIKAFCCLKYVNFQHSNLSYSFVMFILTHCTVETDFHHPVFQKKKKKKKRIKKKKKKCVRLIFKSNEFFFYLDYSRERSWCPALGMKILISFYCDHGRNMRATQIMRTAC